MNDILQLKSSCVFLAKNCDYAHNKDGIGYNAADTFIGHNLAMLENEYWDTSVIKTASSLLLKYKKQIISNDELSYDEILKINEKYKNIVDNSIFSEKDNIKSKINEQQKKHGKKELILDEDKLFFIFDVCFLSDVLDDIKNITGSKYQTTPKKRWFVPIDSSEQIIKCLQKNNFKANENVFKILIKNINEKIKNIKASTSISAEKIDIPGLVQSNNRILFPYQFAGIKYLIKNKEVILADEMGLGKTVQTLAAIQKVQAYPLLIITPTFLKSNWKIEFQNWIPSLDKIQIIQNGKDEIDYNSNILIINYELVHKFLLKLKKISFKSLICDESHYLKNYKSKRTISVIELSKQKSFKYKFLISGTPFLNRPKELVPQLQILNKINKFGNAYDFLNNYCYSKEKSSTYAKSYDGANNLEELNLKLKEIGFLRREKKDVLKELPEKNVVIQNIEIENKSNYLRASNDLINFIGEISIEDKKFLDSISRLSTEEKNKKIEEYKSSKQKKALNAEILVKISTLRKLTGIGKIKPIIEWVNNFLLTEKKLIIFCVHKEVFNELVSHLSKSGIVLASGEQSSKERHEAMEKFQKDPNTKLFIGTIKAAGVGLTLTASSDVLFTELEWRPGDHDQAEDRAHRIGQKSSVTAWYLIDKQTIDNDMLNLLNEKRKNIELGLGYNKKNSSMLLESLILKQNFNAGFIETNESANSIEDIVSCMETIDISQNDSIDEISQNEYTITYLSQNDSTNEISQNENIITDLSQNDSSDEISQNENIITDLSQNDSSDEISQNKNIITDLSQKEKNRLRVQKYRREKGIISRDKYLDQNPISSTKPWEKENISRATWYRRNKKT